MQIYLTYFNNGNIYSIIIFMKRHLFWIVELVIWVLILFAVSGAFMLAKYSYKKQFNTYQIFLPDVDGLIHGSPVRLMGIQIGYVNQLNIVGSDVYVRFIITDKDVRIPQGSRVTVEFTGLGGSKSLEVYPPENETDISGRLIVPESPKRINDSLGLLNDMFVKAMDVAYKISHFMQEMGVLKTKKYKKEQSYVFDSQQSAIDFLDYSNQLLDQAQRRSEKFGNKVSGVKNESR